MSERYVEEACLKLILPLYNVFCFFFFSKASSKASRNVSRSPSWQGLNFLRPLSCDVFHFSCPADMISFTYHPQVCFI